MTFTFHRRMGFYFIQFYIPCIVMVSLSWISFWMDRYYIGERLSLGVTTILTIVFLLGSSNSTMPRVSYAKAIDWYLLGSFIFVFSTLVTDLLVYRLRSKEEQAKNKEGKEEEKKVRIFFFWFRYIRARSGQMAVRSFRTPPVTGLYKLKYKQTNQQINKTKKNKKTTKNITAARGHEQTMAEYFIFLV